MLQGAATAGLEMTAGRRHAIGGGFDDPDIPKLLAVKLTADPFAGQRDRGKHRSLGNAVTLVPQPSYDVFSHAPM